MKRREFLKGFAALGAAAPAVAVGGTGDTTARAAGLPVAGEYDLVVAGGSATGVCAAVTAARAGLKVALLEYNAFFGGTATAAMVPVWHSLYSTDGKTKIIGGLTEEIEEEMLRREMCKREHPTNPAVGCWFNTAVMQIVLDRFVTREKNITPFLKCHLVDAVCDRPGHVTAAVIEDKSGRRMLKAKWFVDATGDADLAARAGLETYVLPKDKIQAHTLCAILSGMGPVMKKAGWRWLEKVIGPQTPSKTPYVFGWMAPVVGTSHDLQFVAATRIEKRDPSVAEDLTAALFEAREQLDRVVDAINEVYYWKGARQAGIVAIGSDLGVRESRHIKAKYRVTAKDVLYGKHFDDCIAKGSYRVDIHEKDGITFRDLNGKQLDIRVDPKGKRTATEGRWRNDEGPYPTWYEIPMRALIPEKAENVLCAGRMIDCEREAYGALRVMVNCNQMGEACANYIAKALKSGAKA